MVLKFVLVSASLQQWFEYCPSKKKHTCPICKQNCTANKACRLYFQSIGNTNEGTLTQHASDIGEDPQLLCREVKRLEAKVVGLNSTIEHQTKDLKELSEEVQLQLLFIFLCCIDNCHGK